MINLLPGPGSDQIDFELMKPYCSYLRLARGSRRVVRRPGLDVLPGEGVRDPDAVLGPDPEDVLPPLDQAPHGVLRLGGVPGARDPVVGAGVGLLDDVAADVAATVILGYLYKDGNRVARLSSSC